MISLLDYSQRLTTIQKCDCGGTNASNAEIMSMGKDKNHDLDPSSRVCLSSQECPSTDSSRVLDEEKRSDSEEVAIETQKHQTLSSVVSSAYKWSQETFPTVTIVVAHLPFALIPFAFASSNPFSSRLIYLYLYPVFSSFPLFSSRWGSN
jgi:hypothetical protein